MQHSHHIGESLLPDASDQFNRCLEVANQVQVEFIRSSQSAACFEMLVSALRIETGCGTALIAVIEGPTDAVRMLRVLAAGRKVDHIESTASVWTLQSGETAALSDSVLLQAFETGCVAESCDESQDRYLTGIPLNLDDDIIGMVALAGDSPLEPGLVDRLSPLLQTCSVLIHTTPTTDSVVSAEAIDEPTKDFDYSASASPSGTPAETTHRREELLRAILENDPNYIVEVDSGGTIRFINRRVSGVDAQSLIGTTVFDRQMPEFRKLSRKMLRRVFRDGLAVSVEAPVGLDSDSERLFAVRAVPLVTGGKVTSALLIGTDITDQKMTQESTARGESLLEAVGELTSEFLFVKDRDSRMVFCNSGASQFHGLTPEQQIGSDDTEYYPDSVARRIREDDLKVMTTGESRTFEETLPSAGGDRVFLTTKSPWRDKVGRILGIVGLSQDITARKAIEDEVAVSEARLRTIIDAEPSCVCLIARDGTLIETNTAGLGLFQARSIAEVRGLPVADLMAPEHQETFLDLHSKVCQGHICDAQFEVIGRLGARRIVEHHAVPFLDSPGNRIHLGITRDVTRQRKAEEVIALQQGQLLHVSRLSTMGQMVAAISHEITQPLSAISNFAAACSLLLEQKDASNVIEEHVISIQEQSERAGNIITRIRDFARRSEPHRSTCDLRKLINEALELVRADLRRRGVTVEFASPEPTMFILADQVQIQQVLMNLISNACDAMQELPVEDRRLWIRCWQTSRLDPSEGIDSSVRIRESAKPGGHYSGRAHVEITDSGPGIDSNVLSHLFDPFYTSKPQGMGLGLSICRGILRSHQGRIDAGNTAERGARFRFTLPMAEDLQDERPADSVPGG